jgi:hypothetical protein
MSDVERKRTPNFPFIIPKMQQPSSKHHALVARQDDERGKSGVGLGDASWQMGHPDAPDREGGLRVVQGHLGMTSAPTPALLARGRCRAGNTTP